MFIATILAADRLTTHTVAAVRDILARHGGGGVGETLVLDPGRAVDVPFAGPTPDLVVALRTVPDCDVVVQPVAGRGKRLLVSDMDSTIITVECIDELADYAGCKAEVAAVTERAMRGELDFAMALAERVRLLAGLPLGALGECLAERVRPSAGAGTLIATARAQGVHSVLVSGGFTRFAEPVARALGFDRVVANVLEEADGRLTGRVLPPLIDLAAKVRAMAAAQHEWEVTPAETLAVGDGANDLPMIRAAGLGVAYRAKPVVVEQAHAAIMRGDLTALLHVIGIPKANWTVREPVLA